MKTIKKHAPVLPGGNLFGLGLTLTLLALGALSSNAAVYSWTGGGTTTVPTGGNWNSAASWNGTQAVSAATTELDFNTGNGTAYTSTDNIAGAFQVNILSFTAGSPNAGITIAGNNSNSLQFVATSGVSPVINYNGKAVTFSSSLGMTLTDNLTITGTSASLLTLAGKITGAGSLTLGTGSNGYVYVTNTANDYSGGTIVGGGIDLVTNNTNASLGTGAVTLNGGTLRNNIAGNSINNAIVVGVSNGTLSAQGNTTFSGGITLNGKLTLSNYNAASTGTATGIISGTGNVTVGASSSDTKGVWVLSGSNTYTGTTTINYSNLSINSIGNVGGGASAIGAPVTAANGIIGIGLSTVSAQLTYTGTASSTDRVINLAGTTGGATIDQSGTDLLKFTSNFTATGAGSKTLTLQGSTSGTGEIGGAIVNNSSSNKTSLTKAGTGLWILSGSNTYTGTTTVSAGMLQIGNGTSGSITSATATVANGATLAFNQANGAIYAGAITNNGTVSAIASGTNTLSGDISGSGDFAQTGSGKTILSGNNTYGGTTTISAGQLDITGTLSNSSVNVSSGATLGGSGTVKGTVTVNSSIIKGSGLTFAGSTSFTGASTLAGTSTATSGYNVTSGALNVTGTTASTVKVNSGVLQGTGAVGNVSVSVSGTLAGTLFTGVLGGAGLVSPGNSPGILTAASLESGNSLSFGFELTTTAPNYANPTNSLNDVLHITNSSTGLNLSSNNAISIYFSSLSTADLARGSLSLTYEGTFYVDGLDASTLLSEFQLANVTYYVVDSTGSTTFNNEKYSVLDPFYSVVVSSQSKSTPLGSGSVLEFTVVPEPSIWATLVGGAVMLVFSQRLRRRIAR